MSDARSREALIFREALEVIVGLEDRGPWIEICREAGGGYQGLQAIARRALELADAGSHEKETSMEQMALVGVGKCGCITAVMLEGYADTAETADFYAAMVETGREVNRMKFADAKATTHFLDCPHADV